MNVCESIGKGADVGVGGEDTSVSVAAEAGGVDGDVGVIVGVVAAVVGEGEAIAGMATESTTMGLSWRRKNSINRAHEFAACINASNARRGERSRSRSPGSIT